MTTSQTLLYTCIITSKQAMGTGGGRLHSVTRYTCTVKSMVAPIFDDLYLSGCRCNIVM